MILKVTLEDVARKITDCMENRITHDDLVEWCRAAMLADEIPRQDYDQVMELLIDLCKSTPKSFALAAKNYRILNSPLNPHRPGGGGGTLIR